jgi:pseudaminic acid cytidylyltransferase
MSEPMKRADQGRVAVIPARGGSKRIPRKNIRAFAGRPMIAHAIEGARAAGVFDRIVVSTDDAEIAAIARALGAELPFSRPAELADDQAGTVPVIAHAITALAEAGWQALQVCCIYPCVPMLQAEDLRQALALLDAGDCDYAFPVAHFPSPVQRALQRDGAGRTAPMHPEYTEHRSQDLVPAYYDAGQFYWGRAAAWLDGRHPHQHARSLVLPGWRVVDIDTPEDWTRAEALYAALHATAPVSKA